MRFLLVCVAVAWASGSVHGQVGGTAQPVGRGKPKLHSTLEVVSVQSGERRVILTTRGRLESPQFADGGKAMVFGGGDGILTISLAPGGDAKPINSGRVRLPGRHLGMSPDGATLVIGSEHAKKSTLFTLPAGGGEPVKLAVASPAVFEAWRPDGAAILCTGMRDDKPALFLVSIPDGKETPVPVTGGNAANPTFSPDGRFLYFDSNRSGSPQIWRVAVDGGTPEQLTNDEFANTSPRVSPDGRVVAFLSTDPKVRFGDRPMRIRLLTPGTGQARVVADFVGGDGTFGSAPWSPDGRSLTFVRYEWVR